MSAEAANTDVLGDIESSDVSPLNALPSRLNRTAPPQFGGGLPGAGTPIEMTAKYQVVQPMNPAPARNGTYNGSMNHTQGLAPKDNPVAKFLADLCNSPDGNTVKITVVRDGPSNWNGQSVFVGQLDTIEGARLYPEIEDILKDRYGGGKYKLMITSQEGIGLKSFQVALAPSSYPPKPYIPGNAMPPSEPMFSTGSMARKTGVADDDEETVSIRKQERLVSAKIALEDKERTRELKQREAEIERERLDSKRKPPASDGEIEKLRESLRAEYEHKLAVERQKAEAEKQRIEAEKKTELQRLESEKKFEQLQANQQKQIEEMRRESDNKFQQLIQQMNTQTASMLQAMTTANANKPNGNEDVLKILTAMIAAPKQDTSADLLKIMLAKPKEESSLDVLTKILPIIQPKPDTKSDKMLEILLQNTLGQKQDSIESAMALMDKGRQNAIEMFEMMQGGKEADEGYDPQAGFLGNFGKLAFEAIRGLAKGGGGPILSSLVAAALNKNNAQAATQQEMAQLAHNFEAQQRSGRPITSLPQNQQPLAQVLQRQMQPQNVQQRQPVQQQQQIRPVTQQPVNQQSRHQQAPQQQTQRSQFANQPAPLATGSIKVTSEEVPDHVIDFKQEVDALEQQLTQQQNAQAQSQQAQQEQNEQVPQAQQEQSQTIESQPEHVQVVQQPPSIQQPETQQQTENPNEDEYVTEAMEDALEDIKSGRRSHSWPEYAIEKWTAKLLTDIVHAKDYSERLVLIQNHCDTVTYSKLVEELSKVSQTTNVQNTPYQYFLNALDTLVMMQTQTLGEMPMPV